MADQPDEGMLEAHPRADPGGDRADQGDQGDAGGDAALPGADPADLLTGLDDEQANDVLELVAETSLALRRGPGRPAGALNRKNNDMIAYLAARGHRDPWVTLSLIQSADFNGLCRMIGAERAKEKLAILKLQAEAAKATMDYHHAKKPQQLELPDGQRLPTMIIGEMTVNQRIEGSVIGLANLPEVRPEKANEINGDFVREPSAPKDEAE